MQHNAIERVINQLSKLQLVSSSEAQARLEARTASLMSLNARTTVLVISSVVLVAFLLAARLVSRLERLKHLVGRMSKGDLHPALPYSTADELGDVIKALQEMASRFEASLVSRKYFEDVLSSMREGVVVTDLTGEVVYRNPAAREMLSVESRSDAGASVIRHLNQRAPAPKDGGAPIMVGGGFGFVGHRTGKS